MALTTRISNALAIAMCDAAVDRFDLNSPPAQLKLYTGSQPTDPDTAIGAVTLLGTLTYSNPAFGNAADIAPGARATANAITSDTSADNTGTAAWFRCQTGGGTALMDGSCATSGADMTLNTVSIVAGAEIAVTSHTVTQPES